MKTRKIVINTCYGGFSLSNKAEAMYMELKGFTPTFYTEDRNSGRGGYLRVTREEADKQFITFTLTRDVGPTFNKWDAAVHDDLLFISEDYPRDDPDLVRVVEQLGRHANGPYSALAVIEIPADVEWQVEEYDGLEHVAEKHRTWG